MSHKSVSLVGGFLAAVVLAAPAQATIVPARSSPLGQKEYRHPNLHIPNSLERVAQQSATVSGPLLQSLARLGVKPENAFLDVRSGRWGTLLPVQPLLPGTGDRNNLNWGDLRTAEPTNDAAYKKVAWRVFVSYLTRNKSQLGIDLKELVQPGNVGVHDGGDIIQIYAPRTFEGVTVRDSYLTAAINHGNLVLFGTYNWGTISLSTAPSVSEAQASAVLAAHLAPLSASGSWRRPQLAIVPLSAGDIVAQGDLDRGYDYRLAWVLSPSFAGDRGHWEALVDAHGGELLAFVDTNAYQSARRVQGGVYPVSNDGVPPDGVEVPGTPMPYVDVANGATNYVTDTGGNLGVCVSGNITSALNGSFIKITDTCGAVSETSAADIDMSFGPGTDCTVPAGHSAGDTHAARTGFYELNKIKEQARGQLPGNAWLTQQLNANMNLNQTCNAFWDGGSVNFFRSGGGCNNTGELAGVFDHEWGHGLDNNDTNGAISRPQEAIADIYAALRIDASCMGRNFFQAGQCGGYGDPCVTGCDGVRDIDWANHASGLPHDLTWVLANCPGGGDICGREVHCEGYPTGETLWDYFNRDLPTVFGMSNDTALEVATRAMYLAAGPTANWYQCTNGSGGCPGTSGYMAFLAVDDDNGNLNDGTPHMQAIFQSFNRHGIACSTPVVQNSGCSGAPTTAPAVVATPQDRGTILSWGSVPGATRYRVFRAEGANGCNFGKALVGETFGTTFTDNGLQNGRSYFYGVMAVGLSNTCMGPMSACTSVAPVAGANLNLDVTSAALAITSGDADPFLDNCENASVSFNVANIGSVGQTNVRINAVQPLSQPAMPITGTSAPIPSLASCASGPASFTFRAVDIVPDDLVRFRVDVTSDQLFPAVRSQVLQFGGTEGNTQFVATQTFDYESSAEGWNLVSGTFNRTNNAPGGAGGAGTFYFQSSSFLDNQCDEIHSPVVLLTPASTLSLFNNFNIEPFSSGSWYDRANVGRVDATTGARTVVVPSSGRAYNASGPGGPCGLNGQQGWADAMPSWAASNWDVAALGSVGAAGQPLRIDVKYGTDPGGNNFGFRFDQVTLTNFNLKIADGQSDICVPGNSPPVANSDSSASGSLGPVTISVLANDSDPNGDCMRLTQVTQPATGTAFINAVGCPNLDTVTYVPNGACGNPCNDSFQYTVSDGNGGTATANVTINQTPVELQGLTIE